MASLYGYITVADLEAYHVVTYDAVDALYTDAVVEAKITQSEKFIRGITDVTTATDGTKSLVLEYSKYLMNLQFLEDHPETLREKPTLEVFNYMLSLLHPREQYTPVDSIPMQGADR